jgi:TolB-like protein/Tfp pilus assembly protein PilF
METKAGIVMNLFTELKRRNVFRVGIAYLITGWLVMQIGEVMAPALRLPDWVLSTLAFFLILGFPLVLIFAWAFELTADGLKREKDVDRSESVTPATGRKLDRAIMVVLVLAVVFLLFERFTGSSPDSAQPETAALAPATAPPVSDPDTGSDTRKVVAVLPFQNLSASEENAFFASGVHEDILTYLSRVSGLRVNSRTSVQQYSGSQLNMKDIAQQLGARYIVEGSVRRAGNQVRVTAQLIDADTDEHLWAENFDRELTDIFAIQTAIAQEIVAALEAELSPHEAKMLSNQPTESIQAYDLFLKARLALQDTEVQSTLDDTAVRLLEQAVEIDPGYAQAWALLAVAHGDYYWYRVDPSITRLERMKQALDRAFELQPDLPEARLALARYYYSGFYDYPKALEQLQILRGLTPNEPLVHFHLGLSLRRLGRYDEAIESLLQATRLDPWYQGAWAEAASTANSSGRQTSALAIAAETERRFPTNPRMVAERAMDRIKLFGDVEGARAILDTLPDSNHYYMWTARSFETTWSRDWLASEAVMMQEDFINTLVPGWGHVEAARYLVMGGMNETARPLIDEGGRLLTAEVAKPHAGNFAWPHAAYAMYLILAGQPEKGLQSCDRGMAIMPLRRDKVHGAAIGWYCAWVIGMAGRREQALDLLDELVEAGWDINDWFLTLSPEWDFLRLEPRFQDLVEKARQKREALAQR